MYFKKCDTIFFCSVRRLDMRPSHFRQAVYLNLILIFLQEQVHQMTKRMHNLLMTSKEKKEEEATLNVVNLRNIFCEHASKILFSNGNFTIFFYRLSLLVCSEKSQRVKQRNFFRIANCHFQPLGA